MSITMEAQRNKLMHLENSLIMYRVYNAETLAKMVENVQVLHSHQSLVEQLFAGQQVAAYKIYSKNARCLQCSTLCDECTIIFYVL